MVYPSNGIGQDATVLICPERMYRPRPMEKENQAVDWLIHVHVEMAIKQ